MNWEIRLKSCAILDPENEARSKSFVRRTWRRFWRPGFVRHIFTLLSGSLLAQILAFFTKPVVARLFQPADFGVYSVVLKFSTLFAAIAAAKYEMAVVLPKQHSHAWTLLRLGRLISLGISVVFLIVVALWHQEIGSIIGLSNHTTFLLLSPLFILNLSCIHLWSNWRIRRKDFSVLATSGIVQSLGIAVLQILIGVTTALHGLGLLLSQLGGQLIAQGILRERRGVGSDEWMKTPSRLRLLATAKKYRSFPIHMIPAGLANQMTSSVPVFALGLAYSSNIVGWFSMAERIMHLPFSLLANSVSNVFYPKAIELSRSDPRLLRVRCLQLSAGLFALGSVVVAGLMIAGPWLFTLVLGERWRMSGEYVRILSPYLLMQFAFTPMCNIFRILNRLKMYQAWEWIRFVIVGSVIYTAVLTTTPKISLMFYSVAMVASYAILGVLTYRILCQNCKIADQSLHKQSSM